MNHRGDFDASAVIYGKFSTYRPSTGAAFTLAGTPALSVYKDNSTTQSTSGVTLTADFDSVTGLNHFAIDTSSDGTFYSAGSFFDVVITTGTVDSVSVVGSVVASFTIRKNSALKPATAGRTLVVDAAGLADANVVKLGPTGSGTAQTARDIGASVLLSSGTGTGQITLSSGVASANAVQISGDSTAADNLETMLDDTAGAVPWNGIIDQGTAQAATGTTLQLRSAAAFASSELIGAIVVITGGSAGVGQSRVITAYNGGTDTATMDTWTTTPTGTITYKIFAAPPASATPPAVNATQFAGQTITAASGVTLPSSVASPTNITAGTITTVTNLTNAPTAGDFTATMKTSIGTAVAASAVASVTGNVGGNVTGSVGSVASGGITATSIAADAIGASELAADAVAEISAAVWAESTRLLTAGTNIVLAKGTGVTGFNDLSAAQVNAEADTAIADAALATAANLSTVDTVVDAIKVTTDKLDDTLEDSGGGAWIFTVDALAQAPSGTGASAATIAAAVWDEDLTLHTDSDSAGLALGNISAGASPSDIADEVQTRTIAAVTLVNGLAANVITAAATASDFGTEVGTAVWAAAARTLTALDEDSTTLDLDATIRGAVGLASANLDTQLDALPTAAENTTAVWAAGTRSLTIIDEDSTTLDLDATIRAAVGLAGADLDTQLAALPTAGENADAVWDEAVDGSTTGRQSIRLANAVLGGKASGLETTEATYRDLADTKDRVVATVDVDGNRTAVTRDLT